jgi:hypothetical protein
MLPKGAIVENSLNLKWICVFKRAKSHNDIIGGSGGDV